MAGFVVTLCAAAVAIAAPAAAIDDPSRPDARVTHGPSCRPGGLVIEVTAGTTAYSVRLATTRQPAGEDEATLAAGGSVVLRSGDVAWGETIDGRLEYTAQDGSGATYVDELEYYSFTRPSQEDCEAITAPASPEPSSPSTGTPTATVETPAAAGHEGGPSAPAPAPSPVSAPAAPAGQPGGVRTTATSAGETAGSSSANGVAAGSTVTLRGTGFLPGERVTVLLHEGGAELGSGIAGDDGTVRVEVRIPRGTAVGTARVDLVGEHSAAVADVELQVAAEIAPVAQRGTMSLWSLVAAAAALVGSVGGLVSVAGTARASARRGLAPGRA